MPPLAVNLFSALGPIDKKQNEPNIGTPCVPATVPIACHAWNKDRTRKNYFNFSLDFFLFILFSIELAISPNNKEVHILNFDLKTGRISREHILSEVNSTL